VVGSRRAKAAVSEVELVKVLSHWETDLPDSTNFQQTSVTQLSEHHFSLK
jgi:hypothetical protein